MDVLEGAIALSVFSSRGEFVQRQNLDVIAPEVLTFQLDGLAEGIYILQFEDAKGKVVFDKILVQ